MQAALTSTSFTGASVRRPAAGAGVRRAARAAQPVRAKYGEEGKYFDLKDLEDTVGSWDMYGNDADKTRYNGLQSAFFERATQPLTRRGSLLAFTAAVGAGALLIWGAKGSKDAKLPITVGPLKGGEPGPKGKI